MREGKVKNSAGEINQKHLWSPQSRGVGSLKDWDLIIGLQDAFPAALPHHHISKGLFTEVSFTNDIMSGYKQKPQDTVKGKKTQSENTEQAESDMVGIPDQEWKNKQTMINLLSA